MTLPTNAAAADVSDRRPPHRKKATPTDSTSNAAADPESQRLDRLGGRPVPARSVAPRAPTAGVFPTPAALSRMPLVLLRLLRASGYFTLHFLLILLITPELGVDADALGHRRLVIDANVGRLVCRIRLIAADQQHRHGPFIDSSETTNNRG